MPSEAVIPLSVSNIRTLTRNLKELSRQFKDDLKVDIEQATCAVLAEELATNIASIQDLDGNYLGSENPNAAISVEVAMDGHDLIWRGDQIAFVEFGTGTAGWSESIGGQQAAMAKAGYHPDPTKVRWTYNDRYHGLMESHGLPPQAPMYHTSLVGRYVLKRTATEHLRRAVERAKSIR